MPYNRGKFAGDLKKAADNGILKPYRLQQQFKAFCLNMPEPRPKIDRKTIKRFAVTGITDKDDEELALLWKMLRENPALMALVPEPEDAPDTAAEVLSYALQGFFSPKSGSADLHTREQFTSVLEGDYIMYRTDYTKNKRQPESIFVSNVFIKQESDGVRFREMLQKKGPTGNYILNRRDSGHMFVYRKYIYFLTRENGGSGVKFGVITHINVNVGDKVPVDHFWGHMMDCSNSGIIPRCSFFCRRGSTEAIGSVPKSEIIDQDAVDRINVDITRPLKVWGDI